MPPRPPDPDYYRVLGVKPSTSAADIKKAYRKLAIKHHPDKQKPSKAEAATQKLARINEAYTVLGDADQRRMHDLQRSDAAGPSSGMLSAAVVMPQLATLAASGSTYDPQPKPESPISLPSGHPGLRRPVPWAAACSTFSSGGAARRSSATRRVCPRCAARTACKLPCGAAGPACSFCT